MAVIFNRFPVISALTNTRQYLRNVPEIDYAPEVFKLNVKIIKESLLNSLTPFISYRQAQVKQNEKKGIYKERNIEDLKQQWDQLPTKEKEQHQEECSKNKEKHNQMLDEYTRKRPTLSYMFNRAICTSCSTDAFTLFSKGEEMKFRMLPHDYIIKNTEYQCGKIWRRMSIEEKEPYVIREKNHFLFNKYQLEEYKENVPKKWRPYFDLLFIFELKVKELEMFQKYKLFQPEKIEATFSLLRYIYGDSEIINFDLLQSNPLMYQKEKESQSEMKKLTKTINFISTITV